MVRLIWFLCVLLPLNAWAEGNTSIQSFSKAKRLLQQKVYVDHRVTLYCDAEFGADKQVSLPAGFATQKHIKRAKRIEWEHVVPAENFGRSYTEWREGHSQCVNSKGKSFRGRNCAEKMVPEYRFMQADMHNLFPAIGAVNALRSNYNFALLPTEETDFGSCAMKIENRKAEPPVKSRGRIARTYLYMAETYPQLTLSKQTRRLMESWHNNHPVQSWECDRAAAIARIQGNVNGVVERACSAMKTANQERVAGR